MLNRAIKHGGDNIVAWRTSALPNHKSAWERGFVRVLEGGGIRERGSIVWLEIDGE